MSKKRQETPNVLSSILDGKIERQNDSKAEKQEGEKVKVTYYIQDDTAVALDLAHAQLRQYTRGRDRKVSKSELAEAAIKMALEELEENGPKSKILGYL